MSEDRRQHWRYRVVDLQGTLQFAHPATVIDLSRSGASVETAEPLTPQRSYPLQLEGPAGILASTLCRVVWCRLIGTQANDDGDLEPVYRAGLEFVETLPEAAERLIERFERAAEKPLDIRLHARHKTTDLASTVLLREQANFEVRTLSRRGMGAEMDYSPRVGAMIDVVLLLDQPIEIRGRVAHVRPAEENPRRFMVGIDFVAMSPIHQGLLERYVERLRTGLDELH